jgi:hypothetical protein
MLENLYSTFQEEEMPSAVQKIQYQTEWNCVYLLNLFTTALYSTSSLLKVLSFYSVYFFIPLSSSVIVV